MQNMDMFRKIEQGVEDFKENKFMDGVKDFEAAYELEQGVAPKTQMSNTQSQSQSQSQMPAPATASHVQDDVDARQQSKVPQSGFVKKELEQMAMSYFEK